MLNDTGQVRRIKLLDVVMEGVDKPGKDDDGFDADAAILTGELAGLIPDLLAALGSRAGVGAGVERMSTRPGAPIVVTLHRAAGARSQRTSRNAGRYIRRPRGVRISWRIDYDSLLPAVPALARMSGAAAVALVQLVHRVRRGLRVRVAAQRLLGLVHIAGCSPAASRLPLYYRSPAGNISARRPRSGGVDQVGVAGRVGAAG